MVGQISAIEAMRRRRLAQLERERLAEIHSLFNGELKLLETEEARQERIRLFEQQRLDELRKNIKFMNDSSSALENLRLKRLKIR